MAGTTVYAIDIMLDTNTKIYTDEGGSGYIEGSIFKSSPDSCVNAIQCFYHFYLSKLMYFLEE